MNTLITQERPVVVPPKEQKETLPPLVKQSTTYKLIVPKKVEEKIRYLCRKFPTLEWSGILFTTHEGTFEDNNLVITCQDLYPMDLGSGTFTEFKMDSTIAGYIADNLELFNADISLIHSHNQMSAFFSGQDQSTLRIEGNDTNCFVSLIVNNAGTYCAAVTRKIQKVTEVVTRSLGTSYEFFGDGAITTEEDPMSECTQIVDKEVIEYFMLEVEREEINNPFDYLDKRFDEIEAKKKEIKTVLSPYCRTSPPTARNYEGTSSNVSSIYDSEINNKEFLDWVHSNRKQSAEAKEAVLFDSKEMDEMIDVSKWEPDPTIIHHLAAQLVSSSLIINKDIDLKQWIARHMKKKYDEMFGSFDSYEFSNWSELYVEFILGYYTSLEVPVSEDDMDYITARVACAMHDELKEYPSNPYLNEYLEIINRYAYE